MIKKNTDSPIIGVDLGGTKILAGVVDSNGALLGQSKRPTKPSAGVDAVLDRMAKTVREAVEAAGLKLSDMAGLGTGAPGPLDPDKGVVLHTPNLPWVNVPLAKMLSERLDDLPVFIENDVNLGTYGECAFGAGVGAQDVVGIFVGTGLGGGLVLGGELRQGWRKACAEVGHMILLADGPVCGCGKRGCAEALASRTAIERDIWAGIKAGRESVIPELDQTGDQSPHQRRAGRGIPQRRSAGGGSSGQGAVLPGAVDGVRGELRRSGNGDPGRRRGRGAGREFSRAHPGRGVSVLHQPGWGQRCGHCAGEAGRQCRARWARRPGRG